MSNVISFIRKDFAEYRKKCRFINRNVNVMNDEGEMDSYPCIVLYEQDTGIPILYTGLERYLMKLVESEYREGGTLAKRSISVCNFLNYLLYETDINCVHDCTIDIIRDYLKFSKKKKTGENYNHDTWVRYRSSLFDFLSMYYKVNKEVLQFEYDGDVLQQKIYVNHNRKFKYTSEVMVKNAGLNVKGPKTTHKKNRVLVRGYLDLLLNEAKKYDPELALGIALEAYAGIRVGETVNLTCTRLKVVRKQFAMVTGIELYLLKPAPFFREWKKKTSPGEIKKYRIQDVYKDFLPKIIDLYNEHIQLMESKGYDVSTDAPLFVNHQGNPMTVQTYSARLKKLFYEHFLPALKITCEKQNTWANNAAFIEIYEKEYPGAHMFRHWFTMYLITEAELKAGEIMKWRGDSSQKAMNDYIHECSEMIEIYRESSYTFQENILDEID